MLTFLVLGEKHPDSNFIRQAIEPFGDTVHVMRVETLAAAKHAFLSPRVHVDLNLVSLTLPDASGLEILRALPAGIPSIVMDRQATPELKIQALDFGLHVFLDESLADVEAFTDLITQTLYLSKTRLCGQCNLDRELLVLTSLIKDVQGQLAQINENKSRIDTLERWLYGVRTVDEFSPGALDIVRDVKKYQNWIKIAVGAAVMTTLTSLLSLALR